jgi:hypothetical protein
MIFGWILEFALAGRACWRQPKLLCSVCLACMAPACLSTFLANPCLMQSITSAQLPAGRPRGGWQATWRCCPGAPECGTWSIPPSQGVPGAGAAGGRLGPASWPRWPSGTADIVGSTALPGAGSLPEYRGARPCAAGRQSRLLRLISYVFLLCFLLFCCSCSSSVRNSRSYKPHCNLYSRQAAATNYAQC